ncbi:multicopper oxidase family protein [Haliscomenobacter hydrossis]|uniref:Multicopper oxidase type 3 n=1 Tax=Haliscomenobacter hydrossis (strain ATCC 27775 / DSM 1100 / LMG 10767 / O) TaxID=760192 RepID=F4L7G6_HALH1|nr:multicopper oxidase family protein [Haliscomenobacter hydrossis]AEE54146.1 multicopper oxidase type 3 [Haliscomenobacter hydrossis DSM 1100]
MKNRPNEVVYNLEASKFNWDIAPGKTIEAWGYNKQLPGPELRANVGDTLVVRLTNHLEEPTLIHWHGLRIPAAMDGTDVVQKPLAPGEVFEYRFVLPDAGTFWYHSHANETVQMERGMYGSLIVEDPTDPVFDGDKVLMIDDMKLNSDNEFTRPGWFVPRIVERHDGREGDTLLINGKENSVIDIAAGQTERWRIVNSSSARYFTLHLGGKEFKMIGTDGGLLEHARTLTEVLITPGERVDIAVGPFEEGETILLESLRYSRSTFLRPKRQQFATVNVGEQKASIAYLPETLRVIEPLARQDAAITRKVRLSVGPSLADGMDFLVNGDVHAHDKPVKVGELQIWEVSNTSLMDHPFHLHGFFFQLIEENGKRPEYMAWKDTVNLPPRSKLKIAWMPDDRPGRWMYHCHIIEHHAAGMMAHFELVKSL